MMFSANFRFYMIEVIHTGELGIVHVFRRSYGGPIFDNF